MKPKFFISTTVPQTLFFFTGQCQSLKDTYDIRAISTDNALLHQFGTQEGIPVIGLDMQRDISLIKDFVSLLLWIWLLARERPAIVHGNTPKASLLSMTAAWLTRVPKRIYMCHGLRYQGCTGRKRRLLMMMERISCRCATEVLCVSNGIRRTLAEDNICPLRKSQVILNGSANGVNTTYFNPANVKPAKLHNHDGSKVLTFIGRLVHDKGVTELVEAVCRLHDEGHKIFLLLIGEREARLNALPHQTEEAIHHKDHILHIGRQEDVRPWLKASWALVLPSYREGFGQVLIEANAMGLPVVASDIVGCNDAIQDGVNGVLCQSRNADALHDALLRLLVDETLYKDIARNCRAYAIARFGHDMTQKAYLDHYRHMAEIPPIAND